MIGLLISSRWGTFGVHVPHPPPFLPNSIKIPLIKETLAMHLPANLVYLTIIYSCIHEEGGRGMYPMYPKCTPVALAGNQ